VRVAGSTGLGAGSSETIVSLVTTSLSFCVVARRYPSLALISSPHPSTIAYNCSIIFSITSRLPIFSRTRRAALRRTAAPGARDRPIDLAAERFSKSSVRIIRASSLPRGEHVPGTFFISSPRDHFAMSASVLNAGKISPAPPVAMRLHPVLSARAGRSSDSLVRFIARRYLHDNRLKFPGR